MQKYNEQSKDTALQVFSLHYFFSYSLRLYKHLACIASSCDVKKNKKIKKNLFILVMISDNSSTHFVFWETTS